MLGCCGRPTFRDTGWILTFRKRHGGMLPIYVPFEDGFEPTFRRWLRVTNKVTLTGVQGPPAMTCTQVAMIAKWTEFVPSSVGLYDSRTGPPPNMITLISNDCPNDIGLLREAAHAGPTRDVISQTLTTYRANYYELYGDQRLLESYDKQLDMEYEWQDYVTDCLGVINGVAAPPLGYSGVITVDLAGNPSVALGGAPPGSPGSVSGGGLAYCSWDRGGDALLLRRDFIQFVQAREKCEVHRVLTWPEAGFGNNTNSQSGAITVCRPFSGGAFNEIESRPIAPDVPWGTKKVVNYYEGEQSFVAPTCCGNPAP